MLFDPDRYVQAMRFAAEAHKSQREPGSELPYLVHVVSVASEVIAALSALPAPQQSGTFAVQCALLHDTVEDTPITLDTIAGHFGSEVAAGVDALSKRAHLPKAQQMQDSLERILQQPSEVAWVKLADRITNLKAPPHYWDQAKRAAYLAEAGVILERLGHRHAPLAERLRAKIAAYQRYLS